MKVGDKVKLVNKRNWRTFGLANKCVFKMRRIRPNFDWDLDKIYIVEDVLLQRNTLGTHCCIYIEGTKYVFYKEDFYVVQD